MKELKDIHEITIRFSEVDSLGIVWHGHYISYFEEGREAFGKRFGISYLDIQKQGYTIPIVKTWTEHLLPLNYGEKITIETTFFNTRAAKLIYRYVIKNKQNQVACKGETVQVFTATKTGEMALNTPEFFKRWKRKHQMVDE